MSKSVVAPEGSFGSVKATVPPHSLKIRFKKRQLIVRVTLHKIPEQTIKFEPTATHFYLDTLRYSKKYLLHFEYPQGIKVDPEKCEAVLEYGILTVTLPIVEIIDRFTGKVQKNARNSNRQKRKERDEIRTSSLEDYSATQIKLSKKRKIETQQSNKIADNETESNDNNVISSRKPDHHEGANKRENQIHSNRTIHATNVNQKKVKPATITDDPMKNDKVLELIECITKAEDEKREKKLQKVMEKEAYFEAKQQQRKEKKLKRQQLRQQMLDKIIKQKNDENQGKKSPEKKTVKRKVSFSDQIQVINERTFENSYNETKNTQKRKS